MPTRDRETLDRLRVSGIRDEQRILLRGGQLIGTVDGIPSGDVLIRGENIEAVAPTLDDAANHPDTIVVDMTDSIVMPGLVDSHVHAWEGQLRGVCPHSDFENYLALAHGAFAPQYRPEDMAVGQSITAAHALNAGITTIVDNSHNSRTPEHCDAAINALASTGIRAVYCAGAPLIGEHRCALPEDLIRLRDRYFTSTDQLLTLRLFDIHPSIESWTFARDHGFAVSAEMGHWVTNLDELINSGLMNEHHTYNHCVGIPARGWHAFADSGVAVNVVPRSEPQFGLGEAYPSVIEAEQHGIAPGLSSDNEIAYGLDLLTEMRTLLSQQRQRAYDLSFQGRDSVRPWHPIDVIKAATTGSARNAGLQDRIGILAPGFKADIISISTTAFHLRPRASDAAGTVVNFAALTDVDVVFVSGRIRKWAHELTEINIDDLVARAESSRAHMFEAAQKSSTGGGLDRITQGTDNRDVRNLLTQTGH
ncbi:amidohydrolase family protein [Mycobacterium sp. pW049]|uniref:amidohydrolase family protein n=1 Tax=[Mycobacterium] bulgaricum TaxID=3238985 RepID=UPI00351BCD77